MKKRQTFRFLSAFAYFCAREIRHLRVFLTVGFCGGFTTFSTFIYENHLMLTGGRILAFAAYAGLSLMVGLVAVYAGYALVMRQ